MNCVGKDNVSHFLSMLLSLSFLLTYGAYLAFTLLDEDLQKRYNDQLKDRTGNRHWSTGLTWSRYASYWSWILSQDYRTGGVGLLALLAAPLAWAMFGYHVYLIWAGTTTNESSKWSELKEYIDMGLAYKWVGPTDAILERHFDPNVEPFVDWPIHSDQRIWRSEDGRLPNTRPTEGGLSSLDGSETNSGLSYWRPLIGLHEVENLYDLGFWNNLKDAIWPM